tara:strand:+ start:921 stop:1088 length:168 start_codon:yes stop_codon:yes gene_type:complete
MKKNKNNRRENVLNRLEEQLIKGTKKVGHSEVSLTDKNIKRINKEIEKLKNKTKH